MEGAQLASDVVSGARTNVAADATATAHGDGADVADASKDAVGAEVETLVSDGGKSKVACVAVNEAICCPHTH